uniref:Uncharacterized protein n=1 Tax=Meloidogyne incognita TaxID=6306 RepID=A0A914NE60_MELIC
SRNNMDIKNLNNGPLYDKTTKCAEIKDCGGTCMKQTFLEVSWSQCLGYVYAHTHLIGELAIGKNYRYETKGGDKKEFNVEIYANSSFKMDHNKNSQLFDTNEILCAPTSGNAIVEPEMWKIIEGDLKDKYLLVFHLLPQTATRWVEGNQIKEPPSNLKPNCTLFIHFLQQPQQTRMPHHHQLRKPQLHDHSKRTTTKAATTTTTANRRRNVCLLIAAGAYRGYIIYEDQQKKKQKAEKQEAEDQLQRTYWLNAGDDDAIEDQNNKRVTADMPKLEDQFVNEIYDRMKKEDSENAAMNKKMLFELYLPALRDKGFEVVGTFNEWKKKSGLIQEKGETLKEFNAKVQKAIVNQSKAAERKKTKGDKLKKDKTPKDPASKKDSAPDKSDAAKSKQAGTTSDIPTDMMSEAKGTCQ